MVVTLSLSTTWHEISDLYHYLQVSNKRPVLFLYVFVQWSDAPVCHPLLTAFRQAADMLQQITYLETDAIFPAKLVITAQADPLKESARQMVHGLEKKLFVKVNDNIRTTLL